MDANECVQQNTHPDSQQTISLINDMFGWWRTNDRLELHNLHSDLIRKVFTPSFLVGIQIPPALNYFEHIVPATDAHRSIIKALYVFANEHSLGDSSLETMEKLRVVTRAVLTAPGYFRQSYKMMKSLTSNYDNRELPTDVSDDVNFVKDMENYYNYDEDKLAGFQWALLELTHRLASFQYKRYQGDFYKRIQTRSGFKTLAFQKHISIETFVYENTAYDFDFSVFKRLEENGTAAKRLIEYLTVRVVSEAPFLVENEDLRSFEGDDFGRGSGVYNCRFDMFFPYIMMDHWSEMAQEVQFLRRLLGHRSPDGLSEYVCTAPSVKKDVALIHLDCEFPHCILTETRQISNSVFRVPIYMQPLENGFDMDAISEVGGELVVPSRWRKAMEQECIFDDDQVDMYHNSSIEEELADALVAELCKQTCDNDSSQNIGAVWYRVDRQSKRRVIANFTRVRHQRMEMMAESAQDFLFFPLTESQPSSFRKTSFLFAGEDEPLSEHVQLYIPLCTPAFRDHFIISKDLATKVLEAQIFIHEFFIPAKYKGETVFFKICTGRNWSECPVPVLETILQCQNLALYDKFFVKGHLGRTLFPVGDLDAYEATLMFEGEGGTGKSTILKIQMMLDPTHLIGIMSPNIEKQFGMSILANTRVCYCAEVGSEMKLPQEEWQISCSGERGSYAQKFGKPLVCNWKAQWVWAGNSKPPYNNDELQVTRRTMGVRMNEPIKQRKTDITKRMQKDLGMLLRGETLAYFLLLNMFKNTQPLSVVERLPYAFKHYYQTGRREADPVLDFLLCKEYVKVDPQARMSLEEFRSLFEKYRMDNNVTKKWNVKMCYKAFRDQCVKLVQDMVVGVEPIRQDIQDVTMCG